MEAYMWLTRTRHLGAVHIERLDNQSRTRMVSHDPELWQQLRRGLDMWQRKLLTHPAAGPDNALNGTSSVSDPVLAIQ
eukprot:scaffold647794_cov39-Prasinocladus_malaysianus.AAC.1